MLYFGPTKLRTIAGVYETETESEEGRWHTKQESLHHGREESAHKVHSIHQSD
jgi:hypothetical protein